MYTNTHKIFLQKLKKNMKYWNKMTNNYILRVTPFLHLLEYFEIMENME